MDGFQGFLHAGQDFPTGRCPENVVARAADFHRNRIHECAFNHAHPESTGVDIVGTVGHGPFILRLLKRDRKARI